MKSFYITTTLPYVNADPHIGFASEIIIADVLARFHRSRGEDVVFNTGTDEHGQKIYQNALLEGVSAKVYADRYAKEFQKLKDLLHVDYSHFIRTTDEHHIRAAQELWKRVEKNGYMYKKEYNVKYCVGCELEKTDSELKEGKCEFHPNKELECIQEENYFFRFSAFGENLLDIYKKYPDFVVPEKRRNEIRAFVERGLQDFSISRRKEKMPWGIPVPGDDEHVMYVWFDALTNYISTLGWPEDQENFEKFWGTIENPKAIQIAGKDNLRQQSAMWQAMLLAGGLPSSRKIGINGFISVDGKKMSKSLGNVIAPSEMVEKFGVDATRYLLLTKGYFGEDNDITWKWLEEKYNADLANGLGNLVSRIIALSLKESVLFQEEIKEKIDVSAHIENFDMNIALELIWQRIGNANKYIEEQKPWELKKTHPEKFVETMRYLLKEISLIADALKFFLPETAEKILSMVETRERKILFERIEIA
ncbi:MAG: methionine--tRNA ligase [Candidatus Moraniibacteriota bacterium]|nr:MAG: methionine--tRNA ligase [Candidatus Moranbacteria bacterium]